MAANYSNGATTGIFLASILLKEMRYLVHIRYLCLKFKFNHSNTDGACNIGYMRWHVQASSFCKFPLAILHRNWMVKTFYRTASLQAELAQWATSIWANV